MWIAPVLRPRTVPNMVQDQITVRLKQHFANELLWWPAYVNNGGHIALYVQVAWKAPKPVRCDCRRLLTGVECFV